MNKKEVLSAYRHQVVELEELQHQLRLVGSDGRPAGVRASDTERVGHGTNNPDAAEAQLAEGLEAMASQMRAELHRLDGEVDALLGEIRDYRTLMVVQRYYKMAHSDERIALEMHMSRSRVNQLRLKWVNAG